MTATSIDGGLLRYFVNGDPIAQSGILRDGKPLTDEIIAQIPDEARGAYLNFVAGLCGVNIDYLNPGQRRSEVIYPQP